jgi:hypothetical protein
MNQCENAAKKRAHLLRADMQCRESPNAAFPRGGTPERRGIRPQHLNPALVLPAMIVYSATGCTWLLMGFMVVSEVPSNDFLQQTPL